MKASYITRLIAGAVALTVAHPALAQSSAPGTAKADPVHITVPVVLKHADVVYNLDHLAFSGKMPTGMLYMHLMAGRFKKTHTPAHIVGVFHGEAAYMVLNDAAYNKFRHVTTGNPYAKTVAMLEKQGVDIEECAYTMGVRHWGNANLLPGVQVTTGAPLRIVQLSQEGYVQIQP